MRSCSAIVLAALHPGRVRATTALLLLVLLRAAPAAAEPAFDIAPTADCAAAGGGASCAGLAAAACMAADPAMADACLAAEADWWRAERDRAFAAALAMAQGRDSATWENPPPSMAAGLRDMERAWLAFRDARCGMERSRWWEHPDAERHWRGCMMRMTAAEVAVLTALLAP